MSEPLPPVASPETATGKALAEVISLVRGVCADQAFVKECVMAFLGRPSQSVDISLYPGTEFPVTISTEG